jgi:lysyl-tRNA synthetase class 2
MFLIIISFIMSLEVNTIGVNTIQKDTERFGYAHFWPITCKIEDIIDKYKEIENGIRLTDTNYSIFGRIVQKRSSSKKLVFYTLLIDGIDFQVISDVGSYYDENEFYKFHDTTHLGDIVGVNGYIGKGKRGELSIFPKTMKILVPCLHDLPKSFFGIEDKDNRYSNRYLDLIVNKDVRPIFVKRSKVISFLRRYLEDKDFMEVETPIISSMAGGAVAKPFITYLNDLKQNMYMRIAPELFLKKLVIGGFSKVFEIGKQFRNESMDISHLPEFTSCELYWAGADYNILMEFTEDLLSKMAVYINGTTKTTWFGKEIDLQGPYPKLDIMDTLQDEIRKKLNDYNYVLPDINSSEATEEYKSLVEMLEVKISQPHTLNRLVDGLIGEFVEPKCIQPTFLINHPQIMSPLAKPHREFAGKTERFELFINKKEFCNAYTELNDPAIQKKIFEEIAKQKSAGDDEIPPSDEDFIKALEYGLPPTGGWGIGIDRLVMLLTGQDSIREVVLFSPRKT